MPALSPELRLRRLRVDEALPKLDKYLNDAFLSGIHWVRIVHGKGTGTLRRAVHQALSAHPLVKSFHLGGWGEGDTGVTIVELANH